ncbi:MAG: amino acid racemase [Woeseiaceae bacterium]
MRSTAGVLGGMGPDTTVDFMSKVIAATSATRDQDHAHLIVDQDPTVPNRQAALLGDGEDPGPAIAAMARRLEQAGADFLVMPCNTAHAFAPAIEAAVSIPLLSIIDVTVAACRGHGQAGILATAGCLVAGLYQDAFAAAGMAPVLPDAGAVDEISRLAVEIKLGNRGPDVRDRMRSVADGLVARGARILVAACTEIPLVLTADALSVPLVSSTDELARATADRCAGVA